MPEYPLDAFPPLAENAVAEYWAYGKQPLALVGSCYLGALSLAAQGLADVARDDALRSPCSLYVLMFGDSGERKSAADRAFTRPLREWELEQVEWREAEVRGNRGRRKAWRAELDGITKKITAAAGKNDDRTKQELQRLKDELEELEQQEPPLVPVTRLFFEEVTQQGFTADLAVGHPTAALMSDEGGIVLGASAMKEESATGFQGVLNRLWGGDRYRETRKVTDAADIRGRRLTISLMVQPSLLAGLLDKGARGIGFLARFLVSAPPSTMGRRLYTDPREMPALAQAHARLRALLDLPLPLDKEELRPPLLRLGRDAKRAWIAFHDDIERGLSDLGDYAGVKDFGSKSAENAARLACLFHLFEHGPEGFIGPEPMQRGIRVAQWYLDSARALLFDTCKPQSVQDAELLSAWLLGVAPGLVDAQGRPVLVNGAIPAGEILRIGPNPLRDKNRRDAAVDVLCDPEVSHARLEKDGRSRLLRINPVLLKQAPRGAA